MSEGRVSIDGVCEGRKRGDDRPHGSSLCVYMCVCVCVCLCSWECIRGLRVFSRCKDDEKDRNTRGASSIDYRERGSHARGVYPTQYTSRMETARIIVKG